MRILSVGVGLASGFLLGYCAISRKAHRHQDDEAAIAAELRLANEHLRSMVEELKKADRIRTEFLNTVSHDLRIPLTTIVGYAEMLQDDSAGPFKRSQCEAVEAILAASERMRRLLEDLLDFARIEAGRFRLDLQQAELSDVVKEAIEGMRPLAQRKHQTLEITGRADLPAMMVDPGRIVQILDNLLSNAVKYTPVGGRIAVAWRKGEEEALLSVSDNGIGIDKAVQPKLFSKFFRVDPAGQSSGHGLGLAISQALAKAHGGYIDVDSEPGRGSTFTVHLPFSVLNLLSPARTAAPQPQPEPAP